MRLPPESLVLGRPAAGAGIATDCLRDEGADSGRVRLGSCRQVDRLRGTFRCPREVDRATAVTALWCAPPAEDLLEEGT